MNHHLATIDPTRNLTFVEADPARHSWFACWDPGAPGGLFDSAANPDEKVNGRGIEAVELRLPARRGTTLTTVTAQRLEMADAIDLLATLNHRQPASPSTRAWANVVKAALSLIADGRVLPWVSPDGYDMWRLDPLGPVHNNLVAALAAAIPAEGHATPVANADGNQALIADPVWLVKTAFDAIADRFLRTPAAHRVGSLTLYADPGLTKAEHLRPWVKDLANTVCASAHLALRVHPPHRPDDDLDRAGSRPWEESGDGDHGDDDHRWRVRFELISTADPSLVVDAADYWTAPAEVMARLGDQAEVTLLAGLRTAGKLVPAFEPVLDQVAPTEAFLDDDQLDSLLDALDELAENKIDVRWPSELVAPRIERKVVAGTASGAPTDAFGTLLDLKSLLTVDWEFLLDGIPLTSQELEVLGQAKRAVVPLRGKWVRLDQADRERLKARPPRLGLGDILAAAVGDGTITLTDDPDADDETGDGPETVELTVTGGLTNLIERISELTGGREESEPLGLRAELRPYQRRGLAWMADLTSLGLGGCLADDMGLGKTVQVLALHLLRQQQSGVDPAPTLVVCPTSLLANWQREANKFIPEIPVRIYHGPSRSLEALKPNELVITSYGVIRSEGETLSEVEFGLAVADEAQQAKNPRSSTAKALRTLNASSRLALSGTPVENRLSELWAIFDWAVPGLLGPLATFRRTTAVPIERDGDERATQRLTRLLSPFLLRRRKTDPGIAPDLPDKIERDVVVALSAEQATLYKATVAEALDELAEVDGMKRRGMVLAMLTKLKQITDHPALFLGEGLDGGLQAGRSGKLDALDDLLADQDDEKTLIFTQYVTMGKMLVTHLEADGRRAALLHGGLSTKARQELVDRFQARNLDVLVLSLKAGGTGLNLTAATGVVHYDRWWNPAVEDQATDRAYRIGQDQTVTVHRLITQGTVEDRVAELLDRKRQLADRVIGSGGEAWISELDDEALAQLVRLEGEGL